MSGLKTRVMVLFRGGVGDFFCWATRLQGILEFHKDDHVCLGICAGWYGAIALWAQRLVPRKFHEIRRFTPHHRPASTKHGAAALETWDIVYHLDVWKGEQGQPTKAVPLRPATDFYPWIGYDPYPQLDVEGDGVGGTLYHVEGVSVGRICQPSWWAEAAPRFPQPVRLLGNPQGDAADWGCREKVTDPLAIYAAIRDAELLVGIDSGFRNVAFTTRTPVLELRVTTVEVGYRCDEVFSPPVYRDLVDYLDLDPPPLGGGHLATESRLLKGCGGDGSLELT